MTSIFAQTSTKLLLGASGAAIWDHERCFHFALSCQHLGFEGRPHCFHYTASDAPQIVNPVVSVAPGPSAFLSAPKPKPNPRSTQRWSYAWCDGTGPSPPQGSLSLPGSLPHTASWLLSAAFSRCLRYEPAGLAVVSIRRGLSSSPYDMPRPPWIPWVGAIGTPASHVIFRWFSDRSSSRLKVKSCLHSVERTAFGSLSWLPEGLSLTQSVCASGSLLEMPSLRLQPRPTKCKPAF